MGRVRVYELTPSGGGWTEQVIYSFTGGNDGDIGCGSGRDAQSLWNDG